MCILCVGESGCVWQLVAVGPTNGGYEMMCVFMCICVCMFLCVHLGVHVHNFFYMNQCAESRMLKFVVLKFDLVLMSMKK